MAATKTKRDPSKPVTEKMGGYFLTEGQALELGKIDTERVECADMNLRALLGREMRGDPMTAEELGALILFADLASHAGKNLVEWGESIHDSAIGLYWEGQGPDGVAQPAVTGEPDA